MSTVRPTNIMNEMIQIQTKEDLFIAKTVDVVDDVHVNSKTGSNDEYDDTKMQLRERPLFIDEVDRVQF